MIFGGEGRRVLRVARRHLGNLLFVPAGLLRPEVPGVPGRDSLRGRVRPRLAPMVRRTNSLGRGRHGRCRPRPPGRRDPRAADRCARHAHLRAENALAHVGSRCSVARSRTRRATRQRESGRLATTNSTSRVSVTAPRTSRCRRNASAPIRKTAGRSAEARRRRRPCRSMYVAPATSSGSPAARARTRAHPRSRGRPWQAAWNG